MESQFTSPETLEQEQAIIRQLLSLSTSDKIEFLDDGWDSRAYLVNEGEAVFKFPRTFEQSKTYAREIALLDLAQTFNSPVQTPRVKWRHPQNLYFGYEGIKGTQLSKVQDSLSEEAQIEIGRLLGVFLKELHSHRLDLPTITVQHEASEYQEKYRTCIPVLEKHFTPAERGALNDFFMHELPEQMQFLGEEFRVCHGDLGPWNMIVPSDQGIGVIDFGDAGLYDRSKDFIALKQPLILNAALEAYGGFERLREKVLLRVKAFSIVDMPYYIGKEDEEGVLRCIAKTRRSFF